MSDDKPRIDDPYLSPLLDAVDEWIFTSVAREAMRSLVLKAFQQGRAKVIRDIAEDENKPRRTEITVQFAAIRKGLDGLERDYLRCLTEPPESLSLEQVAAIIDRVQNALLKQARRNGR